MQTKNIISTIVDFTSDGRSVAKTDSIVYFLEGGVIGDVVLINPTIQKKNYFEAEIVKTLKHSPQSVKSDCPYSKRCGGCSLREYSYDAQVQTKVRSVSEKIKRVTGLQDFTLNKIIPASEPNHYRNNVQLKCSWINGQLQIGFFEKRSHKIVEIEKCMLLPPVMNTVIKTIKPFLEKLYSKNDTRKNFALESLSEIILRTNEDKNTLMLILVKKHFSENISLYKKILLDYANANNIISIYEQNNLGKLNLIYGEKLLSLKVCDLVFQLSPNSFFQVNTKQAELLFLEVLRQLKPTTNDVVYDLFCGVGSISLIVANYVKKVYGIEIVSNAIKNAKANAILNNINNATFVLGSVENVFTEKFLSQHNDENLKIILDPPRSGVSKKTLNLICNSNIKKIIYVSCNPATLARDLKILYKNNFKIIESAIVDMFPYTTHVETVVLMSKFDV